jgi:hypothetical protein
MRTARAAAAALLLFTVAACDDATSSGDVWRSQIGNLDANGSISVPLPREAGNINNLPAVSCYVADPFDPPASRVWYQIGSVQLPADLPTEDDPNGVLSNCIVEPDNGDPNRLMATIEGETPGWLYQIVAVF